MAERQTLPGPVTNTEIYDGNEFVKSIDLPLPFVRAHCAVRLDDQRALLVTGVNMGDRVLSVDLSSGVVTDLAPIPIPRNHEYAGSHCSAATKSDGTQMVVVAGGDDRANSNRAVDESYIYDVENDFWRPGECVFRVNIRST